MKTETTTSFTFPVKAFTPFIILFLNKTYDKLQ